MATPIEVYARDLYLNPLYEVLLISYQKKMKTAHGDVHEVNKTTLKKLNKVLKKKGKLDADDFDDVKFKNKIDLSKHKPVVKKKW